jgi:hypothetical protein
VRLGPSVGYFPEPEKSWCICTRAEEEVTRAILAESGMRPNFTRGMKYVGGWVGSEKMKERWIKPKVADWVYAIETLALVAVKYPQCAYRLLVTSLQNEWQYASRTVPDIGPHLKPVETALAVTFIPALLQIEGHVQPDFRRLLANGVKAGGMAIRDPVGDAPRLFATSQEASTVLVASILANGPLDSASHKRMVRAAGKRGRKARVDAEEAHLKGMGERLGRKVKKRLERAPETGAWLSSNPTRLNGGELSAFEFRDNILLRYGYRPKGLPAKCDGCAVDFEIEHALNCRKGGLVTMRHDDVRDEWAHLCGCALTKARVRTEPKIFYGAELTATTSADFHVASCPHSGRNAGNKKCTCKGPESRGDVLANGFWERQRACVFDVRITNTDSTCYGNTASDKILERHARAKMGDYEEACLEKRRDFTPLVYSVDGMACKAAKAAEKRLASLLAKKWHCPYPMMCRYVKNRMSLAVVRSTTLLLRGDRTMSWRRYGAEDGVAARAGEQGFAVD